MHVNQWQEMLDKKCLLVQVSSPTYDYDELIVDLHPQFHGVFFEDIHNRESIKVVQLREHQRPMLRAGSDGSESTSFRTGALSVDRLRLFTCHISHIQISSLHL